MKGLSKNMIVGALLLGGFAIFGSGLLALINSTTAEQIATNEREALLKTLHDILDKSTYNNALESDTLNINAGELDEDEPSIVYRARKNGAPIALVMTVTAPDGYSGKIKMLVAVDINGNISGVRVVKHKETPGLGDKIDINRDDWVLDFNGKSLNNPNASAWKVKKDGGDFDSFSGATITPRAVVKAVAKSLRFYQNDQTELFE